MKPKIFLGLFVIILCLGVMMGPPIVGKVVAELPLPEAVSAPCGSDPAQVGCWLFSEGSGNTTADGSGKEKHRHLSL